MLLFFAVHVVYSNYSLRFVITVISPCVHGGPPQKVVAPMQLTAQRGTHCLWRVAAELVLEVSLRSSLSLSTVMGPDDTTRLRTVWVRRSRCGTGGGGGGGTGMGALLWAWMGWMGTGGGWQTWPTSRPEPMLSDTRGCLSSLRSLFSWLSRSSWTSSSSMRRR